MIKRIFRIVAAAALCLCACTKAEEGKPRYIWVDASANFADFANSQENIRRDLTLAKEAGFTDIVVDVRPTDGNVLFKSREGIPYTVHHGWRGDVVRTADWDYLGAFIEIGHELGLRVHAGMNTMAGGRYSPRGMSGALCTDPSKKDWQIMYNTAEGIKPIEKGDSMSTLFFNPANPDAQAYLLGLIEDLANYKDLDGIILDRCRFAGLNSDFSELSKQLFMEYIGVDSINWPEDVLPVGCTYYTQPEVKPKYFKLWNEWRAKIIHDFVEKASDLVHRTNRNIKFGVYVGGWYSEYYDVGVNWASPRYDASKDYPEWATENYKNYGYADHCDHMLIGAYASPGAVYGDKEWTMEGFCKLAKEKIMGDCPIVCGGPDVGNWDSRREFSQEEENQAVVNSVKACYDACDGYFLFDMIHLKNAHQWEYVKEGIDKALE
ncbi:MAG: alpha amylase family protein [Candidatus Cryptobacteroides sp.]